MYSWYIQNSSIQSYALKSSFFRTQSPHLSKNNVLASLCALQNTLNDPQHIPRLLSLDRDILSLAALQGLGKLAEKGAVRLGSELRDRHLARLAGGLVDSSQAAAVGALDAVARVGGLAAGAQVVLLGVEVELAEAALCAADPVAQLVDLCAEGADVDVDDEAVRVGQLGDDGVGGLELGTTLALVEQAAVDGLGQAEEHVGLVDEVGAQVEEGAAALGDAQLALPVGRGVGAVAVEVGVELEHAAQGARLDEVLGQQEVGVPAAVLVHADELASGLGNVGELLGLGGGGDEGLLGQDMLAGFEGLLGQVEVVVGRGGDDNDIDVGVGDEVVGGSVVLEVGVVGGGGVVGLGGALDDGVQLEAGGCGDEGDVEDFGGEAGGRERVMLVVGLVDWFAIGVCVTYP